MTTNTKPQRASLFSALGSLAEEIRGEKTASVKSAAPTPADPGGYQGATTHPSKDIDNSVQNASEGSRSAENTADVKEQQGKPSVDSTAAKSNEGRQDEVQLNIGLNASATGEDSSVEDDYKPGKDDPGTDHPARTDNDALDGHKYASMGFGELLKASAAKGNQLLADLSIGLGANLNKPGSAPTNKQASAPAPATPAPTANAPAAGYELATQLGLSKEAAAAQVQDVIAQSILDAQIDAELLAGAMRKHAADDAAAAEGEDHGAPSDIGSGAGEGDPAGGGAPPADPMADAGGGAPPGGEAGGPSEEEAVQELVMAMHEMGISPQELLQVLQGGGAGGGMPPPGGDPMAGGGDPMAGGGGAPVDPTKMAWIREGQKLASAAVRHMRSGRFEIKEARTKRSRDLRTQMKGHLGELLKHLN